MAHHVTGRSTPTRRGCAIPRAEGWRIGAAVAVCVALNLVAEPTAALSDKGVQIAMRTLSFVVDPPSGQTDIAILYDPNVPGSVEDAHVAEASLGTGLQVGQATLRPVLVEVGELGRLSGVRFALITSGLQTHYDEIYAATRANGILSITCEMACVDAGRCVMAIESEPTVEIVVDRTASRESSIEFATAFRMMITER